MGLNEWSIQISLQMLAKSLKEVPILVLGSTGVKYVKMLQCCWLKKLRILSIFEFGAIS